MFRFDLVIERFGFREEREFIDRDAALAALADAQASPHVTDAFVRDWGDPAPTGHAAKPKVIRRPPANVQPAKRAMPETGLRDALATYRDNVRKARRKETV